MKLGNKEIKELITALGFKLQSGSKDVFYKNYPKHNNYVLKVDFEHEKIEYGLNIKLGDLTTSHFENSENFVVLECVDRVLEKGYAPDKISLEHKWLMGRKEKGKLDVLVTDKNDKAYLMIECKTWGEEYEKEKKKMQRDGGQLFSYFQQDKSAQYLCLYASRFNKGAIEYVNDIVKVDEQWKELNNQKEIFDHWNKNFKDNGIFEDWANAYDIEIKALTRGRLKELTEDDSGRIFNQFAEILRHNVVSDKPNAFNKIFNLFLCKIVDEDRKSDEELKFQWLETDSDEELQKRLSDLYKQGMKEYLTKEVTDYNDEQVAEKLYALEPEIREQIRDMFTRVRLHKNNEFAFKEVFDEKSFKENAIVVREVVELLQPYQIRYGHKQQFLGDFFELLLSTGIKQEAGQFFTPVPIAKFIVSSLPIRELIEKKIRNDETNFLPYVIDYAAGSGHFLTEAMDEIQNIIEKIDPNKQRPSVKAKLKSWHESAFDWAYDYVYGIEADYRLVKTAKVSCFLNGDGLANVVHADGLDHFQKSIDYKGKLKEVSQDDPKDNGVFDILVANPPYSVSAFKNTLKFGEESFELYDRLTDDSSEIECLFIERAKQLLKFGGWAGVILPSSILSNSGIYTSAREIILKYFDVKAIAEFSSNTFMATGTNTVTLFLERKPNTEWKKIETAIKGFFEKPKDVTINGIDKAFSKYVAEVFEGLEFGDYISFINKKPNENIVKHDFFPGYQTWFSSLTEVKQIKEKKAFKDKSKDEQKAELEKLFYEKVFALEKDKILYFFLVYPQKTVLIKVGEREAEKDFIGYEFSNRRGHEGIKMYRDKSGKLTTKLYDDSDSLNSEKANSYVYRSFLREKFSVDKSLANNVAVFDTVELMDFKTIYFEKSISLGVKKKIDFSKTWNSANLVPLSSIATIQKGTSITKANTTDGKFPVVAGGKEVSYYHNKANRKGNVITVSASGAYSGYINYWEQPIFASDCNTIASKDEKIISTKLLYHFLKSIQDLFYSLQRGQAQPHVYASDIEKVKIPLLSSQIQEKIIKELSALEQKEISGRKKIESLKNSILNEFENSEFPEVNLGNIVTFKNGLNYRRTSSGDTINIVGVKDFQDNFSPDLNSLDRIQVEGKLSDEYRLSPSDILVVRSNGSVNLVGRFLFLDKVLPDTSFSGFTIRLRKKDDSVNSKYLCYCLRTDKVRSKLTKDSKGSNIKSLNQNLLSSIKVHLPSIDKQNKIMSKIEAIEKEISILEKSLASLDKDRDEILRKYLV